MKWRHLGITSPVELTLRCRLTHQLSTLHGLRSIRASSPPYHPPTWQVSVRKRPFTHAQQTDVISSDGCVRAVAPLDTLGKDEHQSRCLYPPLAATTGYVNSMNERLLPSLHRRTGCTQPFASFLVHASVRIDSNTVILFSSNQKKLMPP